VPVIAGMQDYLLHQAVHGDTSYAIAQQFDSDVRRLTGDHVLVVAKEITS
jgi:hypothetical protein